MKLISTEIRVGNHILINGQPCVAGHTVIEGIVMQEKKAELHFLYKCRFEPIPISEILLLKFGFVKTYADRCFKKSFNKHSLHILCITLNDNDNIVSILDEYTGKERIFVLTGSIAKYIHQLQNLFFSLTGEELEFNQVEYSVDEYSTGKPNEYKCTKEKPMPLVFKNIGRWSHENVKETDYDGDNYIEYKCEDCGHVFRTEMPE